jgi:SAM-dependent methyltransferase
MCRNCGMAFANKIPSQSDVDLYYFTNNKYESEHNSVTWSLYHEAIYQYILQHCEIDKAIGDFGCGMGDILRKLKFTGYNNLYAVDISHANCDALNNLGVSALCRSVFDLIDSDFPNKLEIIICVAVLEHIIDLHGFIRKLLLALSDTGKLIICVPKIHAQNGLHLPFQEFSTEHINYFSYGSLCRLLSMHNLFSIATLSLEGTITAVFTRENGDGNCILSYVERSSVAIECALTKIDYFIATKTPMIVYGVGTLSRYLLGNTRFSQLNILAFADADKNYQGKKLMGKYVINPVELKNFENVTILLCTYSTDNTIEQFIRNELHLSNEVVHFLCNKQ